MPFQQKPNLDDCAADSSNRRLLASSYSPSTTLLLVTVGLFALSGASCPRAWTPSSTPVPQVLPQSPSLEQVIQAVNQRSSQIQSFSSNSATLSGPGYPTLRANLAYQRQRNFRLRAETAITGPEVDLGSNDQLFWFWVRRNEPPAVYFCRHDQFVSSQARQMIPVEPSWLIEALGVIEFDPSLPHQGPYPDKNHRIQVRTIRETPEGPETKITIIDPVSAWVMEQHVYDGHGRLKASAVAEGYRRDAYSGLYMPAAVRVSCPAANFSLRLDLGSVQVNRLAGNPGELWTAPTVPGTPMVDLGDPNQRPGGTARAPSSPPGTAYRPSYNRAWQ